jgi:hypothetical protein
MWLAGGLCVSVYMPSKPNNPNNKPSKSNNTPNKYNNTPNKSNNKSSKPYTTSLMRLETWAQATID